MTTEKADWRTAARSAMHSMNNGGVDFSTESQSESLNICCIFLLAAQAPGTELCGSALDSAAPVAFCLSSPGLCWWCSSLCREKGMFSRWESGHGEAALHDSQTQLELVIMV